MNKEEKTNTPRGRGRTFEKPKDFKSAILRLRKELGNYKSIVVISLLFAIISSILSIISPNKM